MNSKQKLNNPFAEDNESEKASAKNYISSLISQIKVEIHSMDYSAFTNYDKRNTSGMVSEVPTKEQYEGMSRNNDVEKDTAKMYISSLFRQIEQEKSTPALQPYSEKASRENSRSAMRSQQKS